MCRFCRTQNVWYCLTHKEFFQSKSKKKIEPYLNREWEKV